MAWTSSTFHLAGLTVLLMGTVAGAFAQSSDTQSDSPSQYTSETARCPPRRFLFDYQCIAMKDGCRIVVRPSYDPARFVRRGLVIPDRGDRPQTYLLLSLESPLHRLVCDSDSPWPFPSADEPSPAEPDWITNIEVHESWVDLNSTDYRVECLSLDPNLRRDYGTLPSRKLWARWSVCAAGDQHFLP